MRICLALGFYLTSLAFVLEGSLIETATYKHFPPTLLLRPQARNVEKIERIIYFKHLMELKCLKHMFDEIRYKNQLRYINPYKMTKAKEIPVLKNRQDQFSHLHRTRQNMLNAESQNRLNSGSNRIIFLPPNVRFIGRQWNEFHPNKTFQSNSSAVLSSQISESGKQSSLENSSEKKQNIKFIQAPSFAVDRRRNEEKLMRENSKVFVVNKNIPKAVISGSHTKPQQKQNKVESTTGSYPFENYQLQEQFQRKPLEDRPYDVKETVKEELIIDLLDNTNNNDFKNLQFAGKTFLGSSVLKKEYEKKPDIPKPYSTDKVITNSINSVLKTLMRSVDTTTKKSKEIFYNLPSHNSYLQSTPAYLNTYSYNRFPGILKETTESEFSVNRQEQSKQLKISPPHPYKIFKNLGTKSTGTTEGFEVDHFIEKDGSSNFTSIVKIENDKNVFTNGTTEATNTQPSIFKIEKNNYSSNSIGNTHQTTGIPEIQSSSESFENSRNLDVEKILIEDQIPNTQTLFPLAVTHSATKNFTVHEKTVTKNENSSYFSVIFSQIKTTPEQMTGTTEQITRGFLSEKFPHTDSTEKTTEITTQETGLTEEGVEKMKTYFPETENVPTFTEFTDYPLTFDLLTTVKKDQEAIWKNSRKMHFDQETLTTLTSNRISDQDDLEQRRSDILIEENLDDYILDDSFSTLNYLEQIKQNYSIHSQINSTSNALIQLIPNVINDLREGKISPEDISILSKVFGRYWTAVLALSNNTNIDMLPLLKMKDEKDLKNILNNFFPDNSDRLLITTEREETEGDNYVIYDYEDEYNLSEDDTVQIGKKEGGEEASRFKRNEENLRYTESIKEELRLTNNDTGYKRQIYENEFMFNFTDLNVNDKKPNLTRFYTLKET